MTEKTAMDVLIDSKKFEAEKGNNYPATFLHSLAYNLLNESLEELNKYNVPKNVIDALETSWILQGAATSKSDNCLQDSQAEWLFQEVPGALAALKNNQLIDPL